MKKTYIIPYMNIMQAQAEQILAASAISGKIGDEIEIGFGGTDDDGGLDPCVKESYFDFDWDF